MTKPSIPILEFVVVPFASFIVKLSAMPTAVPDFDVFAAAAESANIVPMCRRLFADQLTPVLAYRRLVSPDDRMAPSFLFESVIGGERIGRYSFIGAQPAAELIAYDRKVEFRDHRDGSLSQTFESDDPLRELPRRTSDYRFAPMPGLPDFTGGWVGYAGYDTVRYLEGEKLTAPPRDDRHLPDLHMQLYLDVIAFDHVQKTVLVITNVDVSRFHSIKSAYAAGHARLDELIARIEDGTGVDERVPPGELDLTAAPEPLPLGNMAEGKYQQAVEKSKQYIAAGDIFQVVLSQRFERTTRADPFDIYRALRVVNPSPYMFYLQIEGGMLIGASPEILCRVQDGIVTNRPLAGTRRRGKDEREDLALEQELLADPKERAEHIMLVDLGRNDVGRVAMPCSIQLPGVMEVERYSHVMHISSTVTGKLRSDCDCWDALRYALPVGTVSGAPKVRAMQIIDELEPTRRGPYAGAIGYADFAGNMDMAIALRTMVVMPRAGDEATRGHSGDGGWEVHIQAGAGIVADSVPDKEHEETVNKAAALAKAVDVAEQAFGAH